MLATLAPFAMFCIASALTAPGEFARALTVGEGETGPVETPDRVLSPREAMMKKSGAKMAVRSRKFPTFVDLKK
jgi:hypothetical protein